MKPKLARLPLILSEYKAHQKDLALASCIQSSLSKNTIQRVENTKPFWFYSPLFLVLKPHQKWRQSIDLSRVNTFHLVEKFKMETPESIRASLLLGDWVSSIDLSNAHLHNPSTKPHGRIFGLATGLNLSVHLSSFQPSHGPSYFYHDSKRSEAHGPFQRSPSIPGRMA